MVFAALFEGEGQPIRTQKGCRMKSLYALLLIGSLWTCGVFVADKAAKEVLPGRCSTTPVRILSQGVYIPPKEKDKPVEKVPAEPASIEGVYMAEGFEGDKPYTAVCMIQKPSDLYLFQWLSGGKHVIGCGVRIGDTVSVGWVMVGNGGDTQGVRV